MKLVFSRDGNSTLVRYADADYTNCVNDIRLSSDYVFRLLGRAILWNSKKQPNPSLSTTEAEYIYVTDKSVFGGHMVTSWADRTRLRRRKFAHRNLVITGVQ